MTTSDWTDGAPALPYKNFIIHGIRDFGEWQDKFAAKFKNTEPFRYEKFWLERFIIEGAYADKISNKIAARLRDLCKSHRVNIICHSYGTHLVTKALSENSDIKVENIIFCGAIAKPDIRFDLLHERRQVGGKIYNFASTRDIWPIIASLSWNKYDPSGTWGIMHPLASNTYEAIGHGGFLKPEIWDKYNWQALLNGGSTPSTERTELSTAARWLLKCHNNRLIFWAGCLAAVAAVVYISTALATKSAKWTCMFRQCGHSVAQKIDYTRHAGTDGTFWVTKRNLIVYTYDFRSEDATLTASSASDPIFKVFDAQSDMDAQQEIDQTESGQFERKISNAGRQSIVLTKEVMKEENADDYPSRVSIRSLVRLYSVKISIDLPPGVSIEAFAPSSFPTSYVFGITEDATATPPETVRPLRCYLKRGQATELRCNNINLEPGERFAYCFGMKNWHGDNAIVRNDIDCNRWAELARGSP